MTVVVQELDPKHICIIPIVVPELKLGSTLIQIFTTDVGGRRRVPPRVTVNNGALRNQFVQPAIADVVIAAKQADIFGNRLARRVP